MAAAAHGDFETSKHFAKKFGDRFTLGPGMTPGHRVRAQQQYLLLHQLTYDGPRHTPAAAAQSGVHIFRYSREDARGPPRGEALPRVEVRNEDTIEAALDLLIKRREPVAVLDMAASHLPGGGWYTGRKSQEEELARRTGLLLWLFSGKEMRSAADFFGKQVTTNMYDMHIEGQLIRGKAHPVYYERGGLAPGEKVLIADDVPILYPDPIDYENYHPKPIVPFAERRRIGVIAVAATPYRDVHEFRRARAAPDSTVDQIIEDNVRMILHAARRRGYKRLVLGALGTGAFNNDYDVVANIFMRTIEVYGYGIEEIVFAILTPPGGAGGNREAFEREAARYMRNNLNRIDWSVQA